MERTSKKEGGAVRAKLSPEAGEEVDELEGWDTLLAHQGGVHSSSNVEQGHDLQPKECDRKQWPITVAKHAGQLLVNVLLC